MSDDDPFADLGETLEDDPKKDEETSESATESAASPEPSERQDPMTDSAFSYEAAKQRPFYAREGTIEDFDAWMKYELERELNKQGYQNIVIREMTDALLRTVVEEGLVQEVGERFQEAREAAPEETDK